MITTHIGYILAIVLIGIIIFIVSRQVREHHLQDDPMLHTLKEVLKPVHPIFHTLKLYKGNKSYTINKDKTFLCLYDENGNYYPLNALVYVLLHEVAHSLNTKDVGHTEAFHQKFDELLERATKLGVYNPDIPMIKGYCGHD